MSTGDESADVEWDVDDPPTTDTVEPTWRDTAHHGQRLLARSFDASRRAEDLLVVDEIGDRIKLLDHQLSAAHRAVTGTGRGTLFADEVGLGKTIEVGMVLKEMALRKTRDSFLVLTPAQLAPQWQTELREKFDLDFVSNYDDRFSGFEAHDRIVASVDTAKTPSNFEDVVGRRWDVLVLDEAHYVRNDDTRRYDLLDAVEYQEAFFATATPIQNDVSDLYNLVDLVRPGLLGTRQEFEQKFVADSDNAQLQNADELQRLLDRVMIRNRREETEISFTNREVHTDTFDPSRSERQLYRAVTEYVRGNYSQRDAKHLVLLLLQKEVVSSPDAVLGTVRKWLRGDGSADIGQEERSELEAIRDTAENIGETSKQRRLKNVVEQLDDEMETPRAVVFTQFRPTQDAIADAVGRLDQPVHVVNGDLSSQGKETVVDEFEADGGVLVATDSISEGRNVQFCNVLVNYDLPWNPMKVEQRIGRVDRIGQDRDVHVFNLALSGTVEEHVLEKLYGKIDLFTQSIGGLCDILSKMEQSGADFEREVFERLRNADDEAELENNFEDMAVDLEENREAAEQMEDFNREVFDTFEFRGANS
jgi:SNF2 family DNA or RNA helicase